MAVISALWRLGTENGSDYEAKWSSKPASAHSKCKNREVEEGKRKRIVASVL